MYRLLLHFDGRQLYNPLSVSAEAQPPNPTELSRRKLIRLTDYDYAQAGWYFLTICASSHECLFGTVSAGQMKLTGMGQTVTSCWHQIPQHFPRVTCDVFSVMPNHLHGILMFAAAEDLPDRRSDKTSLSDVVGTFKAAVSRQYASHGDRTRERIWQRGYYEHVIRTEEDLARIRQYIVDNPLKWDLDEENPQNRTKSARHHEKLTRPSPQ
jgi:REP element-mobilizing transposase RayT